MPEEAILGRTENQTTLSGNEAAQLLHINSLLITMKECVFDILLVERSMTHNNH